MKSSRLPVSVELKAQLSLQDPIEISKIIVVCRIKKTNCNGEYCGVSAGYFQYIADIIFLL